MNRIRHRDRATRLCPLLLLSTLLLPLPTAIGQSLGKIYWAEYGGGRIMRSNLDGSSVESVVTSGTPGPVGIALDAAGGKVYWTEHNDRKIIRANHDGSSFQAIVTGLANTPYDLDLDLINGDVYWTDRGANLIQRSTLTGSGVTTLISSGVSNPQGIALDVPGDKMYWTNGGNSLQRANLNGSGLQTLVNTNLSDPWSIALDAASSRMYWTEQSGNRPLKRANLDGSNIQELVLANGNGRGLALDLVSGKMYWSESGSSLIRRANLDGSNPENLISSGLSIPLGLDILIDNCPDDPNKLGPGACGCGVPDTDTDGDGIAGCVDNCPEVANIGQQDMDTDGVGDACDACPGADDALDADTDGVPDGCDICAGFDDHEDSDLDNVPDGCDLCPGHDDQEDCNTNLVPDGCDLSGGGSDDCNTNTVPDECETGRWIGGDGDLFGDAARWDPPVVPDVIAELRNTAGVDNTCVLDGPGATTTLCAVNLSATGSGRQLLRIETGVTLRVTNTLTAGAGGEVSLRGGRVSGGGVSIEGGAVAGYGEVAADLQNAGSVTVRAFQTLSITGADLVNDATGRIETALGAGLHVTSDVQHEGDLTLQPLSGAAFEQPVTLQAGSTLSILGGAIGGPSIAVDAAALLTGFGSIAADVDNQGEIVAIADMQIVGNLHNDGTITIQSGILTVSGNLSGSGTIIGGFGGRGGL